MNQKLCANCAAWDTSKTPQGYGTGLCRRAPPMNGRDWNHSRPLWPQTLNTDWCLSWVPKTKAID